MPGEGGHATAGVPGRGMGPGRGVWIALGSNDPQSGLRPL